MEPEAQPNPEKPVETKETAAPENQAPEDKVKRTKKLSKKQLIIIAIVAVLVAAGVLVYLFVIKDKKATNSETQKASSADSSSVEVLPSELEEQLTRFTTPTTGETWYATAKALPLQGYLTTSTSTESADETTYFEVGKRGDSTVIMSNTNYIGDNFQLYEKTPAGKVTAIMHPDANATYDAEFDKQQSDSLNSSVTPDFDQHYDSLSIPSEISIGNSEVVTHPKYPTLGQTYDDSAVTVTTLKQFGSSKFVKLERKYTDTGLTAISYHIRTPLLTDIPLIYEPLAADLSDIKWSVGDGVSGKFGGIVRGCGAGVSVSGGDLVKDGDFVKAGTTSTGKVVYHFADNSATLVQKAWQETKEFYTEAMKQQKPILQLRTLLNNTPFLPTKMLTTAG